MATTNTDARTAEQWFFEAERAYTENHQGCPWCGGSYRVFCQRRGSVEIYYCQACDFQANCDRETGQFKVFPGFDDADKSIPDTMFGAPETILA